MRTLLTALTLVATLSLAERNAKATAQLEAAKDAYKEAIGQTHDFECLSPAFDDVLVKLDAVPWGTPAKKEAKGLANTIREKRAAAQAHQRELQGGAGEEPPPGRKWPKVPKLKLPRKQTGAAVETNDAPAQAGQGQECKAAEKRINLLRKQRRKEGRPDLGEVKMRADGEMEYRPGSEPTPEEKDLLRKLRVCAGKDAEDLE
jgi:hypothetical protein